MKKIERIERKGYLHFSGYSQYIQEVEKNKEKYYNSVEIENTILPNGCGTKINIII